jgi:tRNA A64-2'-O-ribosylphosphate transferase
VDATRRGKRFPDALSKTVPLWAAVLNRVAHRLRVPGAVAAAAAAEGDEGGGGWDMELHTPLWVPAQERAQMEALLERLVERALGVGGASLREALLGLQRPLRPLWLSPESRLSLTEDDGEEGLASGSYDIGGCTREAALRAFTPLYLVSASRVAAPHEARVPEGARWTWDYVQGAGDDAEHWAEGLSPEGFWAHREMLLGPGPTGLGGRIAEVVALLGKGGGPGLTAAGTHRFAAAGCGEAVADLVTPGEGGIFWIRGTGLGLGDSASGAAPRAVDAVLNCGLESSRGDAAAFGGRALHLPVRHFKERRGPQLSSVLPAALEACRKWLGEGLRVLVHCDDGRDVCVCVAVVVLLGLYSPTADGELCLDQSALQSPLRTADKGRVRQVLAYVSAAYPPAQASRGMLKQVYEFFREPHGPESMPPGAN